MTVRQTKAEAAIEGRMTQLEPGTERYETLEVARRFKTSWVELGERLFQVLRKKLFAAWGFDSFEDYCSQEIRIKPKTAEKLTASFGFLKEQEPAVLRRDGLERPFPDLEAVELIRKAREENQLDEESYQRIKAMALDEAPLNALRREVREALPPREPPPSHTALRRLLGQAERLADLLSAVHSVPRPVAERAFALVEDLRELTENRRDA